MQHGKIVKPYNSVLGEHFLAHWTVKPVTYPSDPTSPPIVHHETIPPLASVPPSENVSIRSSSTKVTGKEKDKNKNKRLSATSGTAVGSTASGSNVNLNLSSSGQAGRDLSAALATDGSRASFSSASAANSEGGSDGLRVVYLVSWMRLLHGDRC